MRQLLRRLRDQDSGEGMAEYALLIALVAICLIGIIQVMRNAVGNSLETATTDVSQSAGTSYGSGAGLRVVPGPTGGGDGDADGDPEPPDSTSGDSLGVGASRR
jgi:Flp pilus assembly pilin Flp